MNKSTQKIKREINVEEWYRPRTIAEKQWINCASGNPSSNYYHILKLIGKNRLKARDFGLGKTKYFRVKGSDLLRYLETYLES